MFSLRSRIAGLTGISLCLLLLPLAARAQTVHWTGMAGDGHWETASNWSSGSVPLSSLTVDNPTILPITLASGTDLSHITFTGGGASLTSAGNISDSMFLLSGLLTLTGGTITASSLTGFAPRVNGLVSLTDSFIQGNDIANITIDSGGVVSGTGGLVNSGIVSNGILRADQPGGILSATTSSFTNGGTVSVTGAGALLPIIPGTFYTGTAITNSAGATMEARQGGTLILGDDGSTTTTTNSGTIQATDAGSRVVLWGTVNQVDAGTITLATGTTLDMEDCHITGGNVTGNGDLFTNGSFFNRWNGVGTFNNAEIGSLTVDDSGFLTLTGTSHEVTGTLIANLSASFLHLTWNGQLTLSGVDARLEANALGGNLVLAEGTWAGNTAGVAVGQTVSGYGTITSLTSGIEQALTNDGTISANATGQTITISGNGVSFVTFPDGTTDAAGIVNDLGAVLEARNGGTLLMERTDFLLNHGTVRAVDAGSILSLQMLLVQDVAGSISLDAGTTLSIPVGSGGGLIRGGSITGNGTLAGQATLDNVTASLSYLDMSTGGTLLLQHGSHLTLNALPTVEAGVFNNGATLDVSDGTLSGTGVLTFGATGSNTYHAMDLPLGLTLRGSNVTIRAGDGSVAFTNNGVIRATGFGFTLQTGDFINNGTLSCEGDSSLLVIPAGHRLSNTGLGVITVSTSLSTPILDNNGTFSVLTGSSGTPGFAMVGSTTNELLGTIETDGVGAIYSTGDLSNAGIVQAQGSGSAIHASTITNNNQVRVYPGAEISTTGNYTQTGGLTRVDGTLRIGGTTLDLLGGMLCGTGTVVRDGTSLTVVAAGGSSVCPGDSPGTLTILGNYTQEAGATLEIEIGGVGVGQFDSLVVQGSAQLGGTLEISLVNGFVPHVGDSFDFLQSNATFGFFDDVIVTDSWVDYKIIFTPGEVGGAYSLLVEAVSAPAPEPSSIVLLSLLMVPGVRFLLLAARTRRAG